MQVSVIIVNYKNPPLILQCVKSILQYEKTVDYEIIVVDNDSQDDTEQQLRAVCSNLKWVQMGYNSGFAKANNAGFKVAEGKFIFYLNSDTIFIEPVFEKMIQEMEKEPSVGMLGCRLVNDDLSPQIGCDTTTTTTYSYKHLLRRNPLMIKLFHTQRTTQSELKKINHITDAPKTYLKWLVGAAVFMRKADIQKHSLLWSEDFFMYFEDMFLGYSMRKAGYKVKFINSPQIIHLGGKSTPKSKTAIFHFMDSEIKYLEKVRGRFISRLYKFLFKMEIRFEAYLEKRKYGKIMNPTLAIECEYYKLQ